MDPPIKLLPVTMNTSTAVRRSASASRPLLGGAAVLMFLAGMVVAPLWAALSLCVMPCCQHPASPVATSDVPCNSDCSISDLDGQNIVIIVPPAAAPMLPPAALACAVSAAPSETAAIRKVVHPPNGPPARARHVVNSVFLI
jgi:hypothetical protein